MKITITQRVIDFRNGPYDALDHGFYDLLKGHQLITIPNSMEHFDSKRITESDLIIFSGGNSMIPGDWQYNEDRLRVEKHALDLARAYNKPILGISRGCQFLTVSLGGSIEAQAGHDKDHAIYYKKIKVDVTSRHGQVLTKIPDGATILATDEKGYCESWKLDNIVTVLWHPERMTEAWMPEEVYNITGLKK